MADNSISTRSYRKEKNAFIIDKVNRVSCKDLTKAMTQLEEIQSYLKDNKGYSDVEPKTTKRVLGKRKADSAAAEEQKQSKK